jgi:O-antigen/teichoic acid export membrane protein
VESNDGPKQEEEAGAAAVPELGSTAEEAAASAEAAAMAARREPVARRVARNATAAILAQVSGKIATLAFTVAAARTLGPADFGAFAYALSFGLLVATLPSWGFEPLLVQRAAAEPRRLARYLSETVVWRTAIAVPVFLAAGIAGAAIRPSPRSAVALLLVLVACLADVYTGAAQATAQVLENQVGTSVALVVQRVAAALLGVGALAAGLGLVGLSGAYLVGSLIGSAAAFESVRRLGVRTDLRSVSRQGLAEMGRLSVPIGIDAVVAMVLFRVDQVMLEAFKGDAAVGAYAATYRLLETVLFVTWGFSRAILPAMSAERDPARLRRMVEQGVGAVALLYVPFAVGLFVEAAPVLRLLYGTAYQGGAVVARWLAPAPLLFAIGFLGSYGLLARKARWQLMAASAAAAVFNIGANLLLIPALSGTGAAIVTTASYGLEAVVLVAMLAREIGWPRLHVSLALPVAASAAMGAVLVLFRQGVVVEVLLGTAVYGAVWYVLARRWGPEQLTLLRSAVQRRG